MASEEFHDLLDDVDHAVKNVCNHVYRIKEKFNGIQELEEHLSAIDYAQMNASLAFTVTSIYYAYLRIRGVDHTQHPVAQELDRVKLYMRKISNRVKQTQDSTQSTQHTDKSQPHVNKEVAERIVRFYTSVQSKEINDVSVKTEPKRESTQDSSIRLKSSSVAFSLDAKKKNNKDNYSEKKLKAVVIEVEDISPKANSSDETLSIISTAPVYNAAEDRKSGETKVGKKRQKKFLDSEIVKQPLNTNTGNTTIGKIDNLVTLSKQRKRSKDTSIDPLRCNLETAQVNIEAIDIETCQRSKGLVENPTAGNEKCRIGSNKGNLESNSTASHTNHALPKSGSKKLHKTKRSTRSINKKHKRSA